MCSEKWAPTGEDRCVWPSDYNYLVKTNNEGVVIDSPWSRNKCTFLEL